MTSDEIYDLKAEFERMMYESFTDRDWNFRWDRTNMQYASSEMAMYFWCYVKGKLTA